jgi:4-amino-4-deoxy-L-arabinose transferase-like glycosyltransferase
VEEKLDANGQNSLQEFDLKRKVCFIFVAGFVLRVFLFWIAYDVLPTHSIRSDALGYHHHALAFLETGSFEKNGLPMIFRTPVFPLFLAAIYKISGPSVQAAVFAQILLSMGSAVLMYLIGKRYIETRFHPLLAVLLVFEPASLGMVFNLYSETLFVFCLVATTYFFVRWIDSQSVFGWIFLSGLFMGITILCRPIAQFLTFLFILWLVMQKGIRWMVIKPIAVFIVGCVLVVAPWVIRTYIVAGIPTISIAGKYNLYYNVAAGTLIKAEGLGHDEARTRLVELYEKRIKEENIQSQAEQVQLYSRLAKEIIFMHPLAFMRSTVSGFCITAFGGARVHYDFIAPRIAGQGTNFFSAMIYPSRNLQLQFPPLIMVFVILDLLFIFLLYTGMFYGVYRAWDAKQYDILIFLAIALYFIVLASAPMGYSRYRVPSMPYIVMTACYGWCCLRIPRRIS